MELNLSMPLNNGNFLNLGVKTSHDMGYQSIMLVTLVELCKYGLTLTKLKLSWSYRSTGKRLYLSWTTGKRLYLSWSTGKRLYMHTHRVDVVNAKSQKHMRIIQIWKCKGDLLRGLCITIFCTCWFLRPSYSVFTYSLNLQMTRTASVSAAFQQFNSSACILQSMLQIKHANHSLCHVCARFIALL